MADGGAIDGEVVDDGAAVEGDVPAEGAAVAAGGAVAGGGVADGAAVAEGAAVDADVDGATAPGADDAEDDAAAAGGAALILRAAARLSAAAMTTLCNLSMAIPRNWVSSLTTASRVPRSARDTALPCARAQPPRQTGPVVRKAAAPP